MLRLVILITQTFLFSISFYAQRVFEPPIVTSLRDYPSPTITTLPSGFSQGNGFFTTFDTDDGLAMDVVSSGDRSALYDSNGNLWFCTPGGGLSRYDGKYFTTYTTKNGLPHNIILCIIEDREGILWIGTGGGGISKYDGTFFTTYSTKQGLVDNQVSSITTDIAGNIWVGTGNGISKYDGKSFTNYTTKHGLAHNDVNSIIEDNSGNFWIGTNNGVSKYNGRSFTNYTTKHGLAHNNVLSITEDKLGNLWFGTDGGGVSKYDGKTFVNYSTEQGLVNNRVSCIVEGKEGNLWFGTHHGVSMYDGNLFTSYTVEQGLANNRIKSITEDKWGNLWFGTGGGGVSKYGGKSFNIFTTKHGLANNIIFSITEDGEGNVWFGTLSGGVSKYDGKSFVTYSTEQGLVDNQVSSIIEDSEGNIWIGTKNGVSKYNGKTFTNFTTKQGLAKNWVFSIIEDRDGNIWFGTGGGGVSKYDGKSFKTYTTEHGLPDNFIFGIIEDKLGNLWFSTNYGVSRYDGSSFTTFTVEHGLADNIISSSTIDRAGNIWFGTESGLSMLRENLVTKIEEIKFITITTADGLPDNKVTAIIEDNVGNIIIGTTFGLGIIPSGDLNNGIEIYNQFTGYPVRDVNGGTNNGVLFCDSDGIIWIGTGSDKTALVRFDYGSILRDYNESAPSKLVIQKVRIKGHDVCWYNLVGHQRSMLDSTVLAQQEAIIYGRVLSQSERDVLTQKFEGILFEGISNFYPLPANLVLPFKFNHITFDFLAIESDRNYLINYQYKLEGQDENWSAITKETDVTYNNLKEGSYTFLVRAQSPWGVWSEPVTYSFTVLPPWYRTWWSYAVYFIASIYIIWSFARIRTRSLKLRQKELMNQVDLATKEIRAQKEELSKKNEEKTAMMKEIHHRVKNNLQVVNSLLRLQSYEVEDERVVKMFEESQNRVLSMALLHEKMYSSDDIKHINIHDHFSLLVEDLVKSYAVEKEIELDIQIGDVDIGMKTLVPLGLIINEIITNALKYAFEGRDEGVLTVHLNQLKSNKFELIIGDNGLGMDKDFKVEESSSFGTELIQIFTEQLGGKMVRLDVPGTLFRFEFEKMDEE